MSNDTGGSMTDKPRPRFPLATLLKALLPALAATVLVVFLIARIFSGNTQRVRSDGMMRVTMSQKDSAFHAIPPSAGGATGVVWYAPKGSKLHFQMHVSGLPIGRRYALELQVDSTIYTVASYAPDVRGSLVVDTTLVQFEEGVCVGTNYDSPHPISGHHRIKFWIKRDGSPLTGTMPGIAPTAPGAQLTCHGNGDGKYGYVLLENEVADFTGTGTTMPGGSQ